MDGMEILQKIYKDELTCEVIVITGHGNVNTAITAMQHSALNFLEKPISRKTNSRAL